MNRARESGTKGLGTYLSMDRVAARGALLIPCRRVSESTLGLAGYAVKCENRGGNEG
jgi:hypothetical protein